MNWKVWLNIYSFNYIYILSNYDKIEDKEDTLSVAFRYTEEEIDIRVESVKIQVEEIGNKVKEKLQIMRNEILK